MTAWTAHSPSTLVMSHTPSTRARVNLTLSISTDEGVTWPESLSTRVPTPGGYGGYSDVQILPNGVTNGYGGYSDAQILPNSGVTNVAAILFERGGSDSHHHQGCGGIDITFVPLSAPA